MHNPLSGHLFHAFGSHDHLGGFDVFVTRQLAGIATELVNYGGEYIYENEIIHE